MSSGQAILDTSHVEIQYVAAVKGRAADQVREAGDFVVVPTIPNAFRDEPQHWPEAKERPVDPIRTEVSVPEVSDPKIDAIPLLEATDV